MRSNPPSPAEIIDLDRYPIHDPESPKHGELLAHCRAGLRRDGCCSVQDFIRPDAIASFAEMLLRLLPEVHRPREPVSPYGGEDDPSLPADHPRRRRFIRGGGFICADRLDQHSGLWSFFDWPATTRFMMAAFETEPLHRYADPLASLATNVMTEGDAFPWHFDTNELTVSIMVQAPEAGGTFEYVPDLRTPGEENYGAVRRVLDGGRDGVQRLTLQPGDMQLFRGRYTLHRVTKVTGARARIVALPSWSSKPGQVGVVERMIKSYGRALPIHYSRAGLAPDGLAQ